MDSEKATTPAGPRAQMAAAEEPAASFRFVMDVAGIEATARSYAERGVAVVSGVLDAPAICDAVEAWNMEITDSNPLLGPLHEDNPRLSLELSTALSSIAPVIRKVEPFLDAAPNLAAAILPRMQALATAIFGETAVLFEDKANLKEGGGLGSAFPWHQDQFYWTKPMASRDYSPTMLTIALFLEGATLENGCLEVLPLLPRGPAPAPSRPSTFAFTRASPSPAAEHVGVPLLPHARGPVEGGADDFRIEADQLWGGGILAPVEAGGACHRPTLPPCSSAV